MLYSYIIPKDVVKDYFPETSPHKEYEEGGDATEVSTNLVCVKSNKWIDIHEKDRYIPFSFSSECDLEEGRLDLMMAYIEKRTGTKGVYFSLIKRLGEKGGCEYYCYIGDDSLYVSEKDSYIMKEDLSSFERGDVFLTDDEHEGKCYDVFSMEGVWHLPGDERDDIETPLQAYFDKSKLGCDILALHDNYDGDYFYNLTPFYKEQLSQIEDGKLPSIVLEKKKWPGMIERVIRKEEPIYTPNKILDNLREGKFHFGNYPSFLEDLGNVKDCKVKVIVTDSPLDVIYNLKMNDIDFLLVENDGIYEIVAQCESLPEYSPDFPSLEQHIINSCKNSDEILKLTPLEQMDVFIDDGYGIKLDKKDMIYVNPHTGLPLPQNIIHSTGTLCSGIGIPVSDYDPHREVHIEVPVRVEVERIDDGHVSIYINTHQERCCLEGSFPHCSPSGRKGDMKEEYYEENELKSLIRKLWTRGYLLDDLGLVSILYYNRMHEGLIIKPWWFQHRDHRHANDLLKFISSL